MEKSLHWDIFCRVIDNFGDIGVCWRLSYDLAMRGHQVRLWLDDASALAWMAPNGHPRITVIPWTTSTHTSDPHVASMPDVIVEGFGCGPDEGWLTHLEQSLQTSAPQSSGPVWINLEYLSAQAYVERSHGLPSLSHDYPRLSEKKYFFYPGFTPLTGGLIREPWLAAQAIPHEPWVDVAGNPINLSPSTTLAVSLFCYETAPVAYLFEQLLAMCITHANSTNNGHCIVKLIVTAGKSTELVQKWLSQLKPDCTDKHAALHDALAAKQLQVHYLPLLTHRQYDALLRQCQLNCVRGEDSLVRALWAQRPFLWQLYEQEGGHHAAKLQAFIDQMALPPTWAQCLLAWNQLPTTTLAPQCAEDTNTPSMPKIEPTQWASTAHRLACTLANQTDLVTQLVRFVNEKR